MHACGFLFFLEKKSHAPFKFNYNFWWLVGPQTSKDRDVGVCVTGVRGERVLLVGNQDMLQECRQEPVHPSVFLLSSAVFGAV